MLFKTPVIEFGLLSHSDLDWLGASPDGITPDGIMLEIKNPNKMYKIPSLTYYTQTQIQMESADLDVCDFLVFEVKELDCEQDFLDKILDKISKSGYESLSKTEKEILFKASGKNK